MVEDENSIVGFQVPFGISLFLLVCCAVGSALFSGLTLGLMTLDCVQLRMLIDQPDKTKTEYIFAKYARRVLKVRKDGNYLLVTLLIGNVAVNSAFTILLGNMVSELVALIISVAIITLFGEIVPQAVCARHGLIIGGWMTPVVWVLEWLLFPVVKPIAVILNWSLGEEIGSLYSKKQLKMLVDHHQNQGHIITRDEARILHGGLEFAVKTVQEAMTPIDSVFGLDIDGRLDYENAASMLRAGFSRVPIFDRSQKQCIVGVVFVRDLVLMDPEAEVTVRTAMAMLGRKVYAVDNDTTLLSLLTDFKQGHTHLAVVRRVVTDTPLDPFYEHIGIITLEDIIEEIIQDEIYDEAEVGQRVFNDNENNAAKSAEEALQSPADSSRKESHKHPKSLERFVRSIGIRGSRVATSVGTAEVQQLEQQLETIECKEVVVEQQTKQKTTTTRDELEIYANQMLGRIRLFDKRRGRQPLDEAESVAVGLFISATQPSRFGLIPAASVQEMLRTLQVETPPPTTVLYTRRKNADVALLVLQGKVKVVSGEESFVSNMGPWSMLGIKAIGVPSPVDIAAARAVISSQTPSITQGRHNNLPITTTADNAVVEEQEQQMQYMRKLDESVRVSYLPDFTASVLEQGTRLLRITQDAYLRVLKANLLFKCATTTTTTSASPPDSGSAQLLSPSPHSNNLSSLVEVCRPSFMVEDDRCLQMDDGDDCVVVGLPAASSS
eukprot:GHVS01081571.1.p1 GENE.GHVS01081571.1~~GHVS01081571.1.p1  ORF type:complete len:722 (+),score=111.23 GHVS01081571.1:478-2643(+)